MPTLYMKIFYLNLLLHIILNFILTSALHCANFIYIHYRNVLYAFAHRIKIIPISTYSIAYLIKMSKSLYKYLYHNSKDIKIN